MPHHYNLRHSILTKVLALSLGFSLVIGTIVCVISVVSLYDRSRQATIQSIEYSLQVTAADLTQSVNEIDSLAAWSTANSTVRSFVLSNYRAGDLVRSLYDTVFNKYSSMHTALYIQRFIVTDGESRIMQQGVSTSNSRALNAQTLAQLPGMASLQAAQDYVSWSEVTNDNLLLAGTQDCIPVVRAFGDSAGRSARVYIGVSPTLITDAVRNYTLLDGCALYWIMNDKAWQIEGRTLVPLELTPSHLAAAEQGAELMADGTTLWQLEAATILIASPVGSGGMYLAQTLPQDVVADQLPGMQSSLLIVLAGILLLGIVLAMLLRRIFVVPVEALQARLAKIAGGDFSTDPLIEWPGELGDIGRGINQLSRDVDTLMTRRLEDQRQKQELEYRMLQNEINPHFIYNTLNSIRWMATIQHAPGIAEMVTALARLLKSISKSNEKLVPLQDELALLNDYFTIQQYRYGGDIHMDVAYIEAETICRDCRIPRFTLQPLAENAIFHGLEPRGGTGSVLLDIRTDGGDVLVKMTDDGVGIAPARLATILQPPAGAEKEEKFRHVGLWNVHHRLQYAFGERYGLHIESEEGVGTEITVRLPGMTAAPALGTDTQPARPATPKQEEVEAP